MGNNIGCAKGIVTPYTNNKQEIKKGRNATNKTISFLSMPIKAKMFAAIMRTMPTKIMGNHESSDINTHQVSPFI